LDPHVEERVASCPALPTLPAVALEVLRLCQEDEVDLARIADAVRQDPAIAAKLLRIANSASFATRGKVTTLTRAIALVGSSATVSVALSFALVRGRRRADGNGFDLASFWRRSLFAGLAGRALGELCGCDGEEAFLAALLQDLGVLALNAAFPAEYGVLWRDAEGDHEALVELEREVLGADHGEAGELLARLWRLPDVLRAAPLAGHDLAAAPAPGPRRRLLEVVHLSGRLADVWVSRAPGEATRRALEEAAPRAGVGEDVLHAALGRMALAVPEAAADFDLDLGGPERVEEVLAEARAVARARAAPPPADGAGARRVTDVPAAVARALEHARGRLLAFSLLVVRPDPDTGSAGAGLEGVLLGCLRQTDLVGAHGGALAALLFETPRRGALVVAERVRSRAEAAGIAVSVGIAPHEPGEDVPSGQAFVRAAVAALDAARSDGGDRISWWSFGDGVPVVEG
jgi:HD-like signal output (HDOD) protein